MAKRIVFLAFMLSTTPVLAETVDGNSIRIIDGDTVALPCAEAKGPNCAEKIRFIEIDTPETFRPHCDEEREQGLRATARLVALLRDQPVTIQRDGTFDRYGRARANVAVPAGDVGTILLKEDLARPYTRGAKAKAERIFYWCGPDGGPLR